MSYTVTRGAKGKVEIKVDVPKPTFETAYKQILSQLGQEVKIAGFRPGKVPTEIIEKHLGLAKILNETASFLVSKHLAEILQKEDLLPLDSPKIAINSLTRNGPFSFTASFTQKPSVKLGDWKKIKVAKAQAKEITEKDINESIKNIFAMWKKQQETRGQKQEPQSLDDESAAQGKKFIYDAHGNKIFLSEEKKPGVQIYEIDDEFAKAIGAKDLAHLREIVKKDLETIVADQVEAKFEQEIFEKLAEINEIEVPDILVEDELNRMLFRLQTNLEQRGQTLENYLVERKTTIEELKTKWRQQAEKNVKIALILEQIGKEGQIEITKEEVEKTLANINQTNLTDAQRQDLVNYMAFNICQVKTLDLVKKTVGA